METDLDKIKYLHTQVRSLHHNNMFSKYIINTRENLEDMMVVLEELKQSYKKKD